jgi:hypothetical protein
LFQFTKASNELIGRLYLGIRVVDYKNLEHEQNLVVPDGTSVEKNPECTWNKLKWFKFNQKENSDVFDIKTKCVYSKITTEEKEYVLNIVIFYSIYSFK